MQLTWHGYRYYPYERALAAREAATLLKVSRLREVDGGLAFDGAVDLERVRRLTYFAGARNRHSFVETVQAQLETTGFNGKNRQATRYSVHGLHDYKGKFNPQVVRAILNIFDVHPGNSILDPFCGSGTTLVECAHLGALGYGIDLNPLAVFIANAKLQALATPASELRRLLSRLSKRCRRARRWTTRMPTDPRGIYLQSWFDRGVLHVIEILRAMILDVAGPSAPVFLSIASNLLRDYSQQDPNDLRIRRRQSPVPEAPFVDSLLTACERFLCRVENTQTLLGTKFAPSSAVLKDVGALTLESIPTLFDAAITSPPYAMALPYIDTQRLSLVWLELLPASGILELESNLIGSREIRGANRNQVCDQLATNEAKLPRPAASFCIQLQDALRPSDGFRRRATPILLYRYFAAMHDSFRAIRSLLKPSAPFALIVGHNHTVLGGVRYDINTPGHLAALAKHAGWIVEELMPLQTYHRYGYHVSNAVAAESLLILKVP